MDENNLGYDAEKKAEEDSHDNVSDDLGDVDYLSYGKKEILGEKHVSWDEYQKHIRQLADEVRRKDDHISFLKDRNKVLIQTTVKQGEKITELIDKIKRLHKKYATESENKR